MTANTAGPGAYILTCDGSKWVATINAELPTANAQVANKEYVDNAVAAGILPVCTNDYASLCVLETNRAGNDPQFTSANIANGVNILGVTGSLTSGLPGPAGCSAIGDKCADTTIFAGFHPVTHEHLFIPPTDQGTTYKWKTATGADDINPGSDIDGRVNHANRAGAIANFPAFKACEDLTLAGKSWYLPSRVELDYLYNNRSAYVAKAPGNGFINFQNTFYWSSTEYNTSLSWVLNFTGGYIGYYNKTNLYRVRCVGR